MPLAPTFPLGPFTVDTAGRLAPLDAESAPAFLFRWRDRVFRARITQPGATEGRLSVQVPLGRVPSSARAPAARPDSFALVRLIADAFPGVWHVRLLPDHRVRLEAEASLPLPVTAVGLLAEVTRFLLALSPYLDMFDESGMAAPALVSGDAGRLKTWPG